MLRRLELVGFKSFAEKTQFDFGPGITAIVGPNGSGKSNVVDAVRWILGEQSAKSLRGGEMVDVIFNGSSSRRSLGMAEVTLTLDNGRRTLATEADELQVTRRVFRSGEGEYLINKQPARLKDIKDLFLGSGAGADAYSIIEQGRVDVLLQASTRERRTIFEEAAGISRFKAKKTETLRKLERVEQNLLRLCDIIEEVDRQLRSVKLQAAKAQRYQEHTGRVKDLRVALSLDEYHRRSIQLQQLSSTLATQRAMLVEQSGQAAHWDAEIERREQELAGLDAKVHAEESSLANARQRLAAEESTLQHERTLTADLEQDLAQTRVQLQSWSQQLRTLTAAIEHAAKDLAEVDADCDRQRAESTRLEKEAGSLVARLHELQQQRDIDKEDLVEQVRLQTRCHNEEVSLHSQATAVAQHRLRLVQKSTLAGQALATLDDEVRTLQEGEERFQSQVQQARDELAEIRRRRDETRQLVEATSQQLGALREQRSGLASRMQVLEDLEQSQEGLSAGVQEVLALLHQPEPGPWQTVLGLVADLLSMRREVAPLIELALGERAQYLLVRDAAALAEALRQRQRPFSGRVSFLPVTGAAKGMTVKANRFLESSSDGTGRLPLTADGVPDHPGVVALAARLVTCTHPELHDAAEQLFGGTLIVRDLAAARAIAALTSSYRYVTLQGDLLEPGGLLTVGAHRADSGLLSRKSELRELREQLVVLDQNIAATEYQLGGLRELRGQLDVSEENAQQQLQRMTEQASDLRSHLSQQRQRHEGLAQELQLGQKELGQLDEELADLQQAHGRAAEQARAAESRVKELQARQAALERETRVLEEQRQQREQVRTAAKVGLAKAEERRNAVAARHQRAQQDGQQRHADLQKQREHLDQVNDRLRESERTMLRASAAFAQASVDKEQAARQIAELLQERACVRLERQQYLEQVQTARQQWQQLQAKVHADELEASNYQHQLTHLAARLHDEHELDLIELHQGYQPPETMLDPQAAEEEMAELRRKISRLGSVNVDALLELAELEARAQSLQTQHDDLTSAKGALDEIIAKINQDSRKMFGETFAAIRSHFQDLFRKLFGGGMADVVLEDETDILESGIEIIARPPGKELRSISLLSGGEKTLTAVALLLAIFRNKPSPFCILDEVDAALDEANIGRYTTVLREFLDQSQFIIVTHSKKTMAMADVLYGVTMQESGVSKRVAVRFEDWPEDQPTPQAEEDEEADMTPVDQAESAA